LGGWDFVQGLGFNKSAGGQTTVLGVFYVFFLVFDVFFVADRDILAVGENTMLPGFSLGFSVQVP
jgi:hypothetical protein